MSRNILDFNTIAERKIAFPTEIGYFSPFFVTTADMPNLSDFFDDGFCFLYAST